MYHLTVIATLQWAWTFLTGIYGMNFVDEDGKVAVPRCREDDPGICRMGP